MIDYLERLLDREAEEETQEAFVWPKIGLVGWQNGAGGAAEEERKRAAEHSERGTAAWQAVLEELAQAAEAEKAAQGRLFVPQDTRRGLERSATVEPVWEWKTDPGRELAELARAAKRGRSGQASLLRNERTEAGRTAEVGRDTRRREELRVETRRGLARRLDAAFERDARRYDGPLGLL